MTSVLLLYIKHRVTDVFGTTVDIQQNQLYSSIVQLRLCAVELS